MKMKIRRELLKIVVISILNGAMHMKKNEN